MVGWHHRLSGHEFEWALGVGDGQRSLACCSPWGHKESDTTEWLNWTDVVFWASQVVLVVKTLPANAGDVRTVGSIPGLGRCLEEGMATQSTILAWKIPWSEEPGGLQSIGLHRNRTQLKWHSMHVCGLLPLIPLTPNPISAPFLPFPSPRLPCPLTSDWVWPMGDNYRGSSRRKRPWPFLPLPFLLWPAFVVGTESHHAQSSC